VLAATFTFLTPRAALLVLLAVVPVAALVVAARRVERARTILRLAPPGSAGSVRRAVLLGAVVGLLTLAAMQPVVRTQTSLRERTDAQAFVVLDVSRSMAAAPRPGGRTRLARAKAAALSVAGQLGDVPVGLATLTDRALPDLFPTSDRASFDSATQSLTVEDPPPREVNTVATTFDALRAFGTQGFFPQSVRKRAVILVTDGESRPFDPGGVAQTLGSNGIQLAVVRVGSGADRVWRADGKPEANFRPDPRGAGIALGRLATAAHAPSGADAGSVIRRALGSGPSAVVGVQPKTRSLAPLPAILALVPLAFLLGTPSRRQLRDVTFSRSVRAAREG
jgi:VWA domain-containing protein